MGFYYNVCDMILGKSVCDEVYELVDISVWYSVYNLVLSKKRYGPNEPIRYSVSNSIIEPINNSTRWRIKL